MVLYSIPERCTSVSLSHEHSLNWDSGGVPHRLLLEVSYDVGLEDVDLTSRRHFAGGQPPLVQELEEGVLATDQGKRSADWPISPSCAAAGLVHNLPVG